MESRILVVDDEESLRYSFQAFLSQAGYEVKVCSDFPSAVSLLSTDDYDLVFADIVLDGQSGIDLLSEIKRRNLHCPVILFTGQPTLATAQEAVRLGAYDYVQKPVRKETLLRLAKQALHQKHLADENTRISEERERYRANLEAILQSVRDAIITVNREMRVIQCNEASRSLYGISPGMSLDPQSRSEHPSLIAQFVTVLQQTVESGRVVEDKPLAGSTVGEPLLSVKVSCTPLLDASCEQRGAVLVVRDLTRLMQLEREVQQRYQLDSLIGRSTLMQKVFNLIEDVAETDATVLITGESGTGKELVARTLHNRGLRAGKPFVAVNCSALAEGLLESELFGHVRGAFTGAVRDKIGRYQAAQGGTLLLDEIGDVSLGLQSKLLRVLQEREFERVGDTHPIKADVRIIACTNCDLRRRVRESTFREDLYYRLRVVEIALPALRDRKEDIPPLVSHFCDRLNAQYQRNIVGVSPRVDEVFMEHDWPGNVRELQHTLEHAFILCHGTFIDVEHLPTEFVEFCGMRNCSETNCGREEILQNLQKAGWNKAKAARLLGISRQTLYRKLDEMGIETPSSG